MFGSGLGYCDPARPNVRYLFVGHFLPGESRERYVGRVASALRDDGWRTDSKHATDASVWTHAIDGGATLSVRFDSVPAIVPSAPELIDLDVTASAIVATGPTALPEARGDLSTDVLSQMTIFYPATLPAGIRRDFSRDLNVVDYSFRRYSFADARGALVSVDERPGPATVSKPCDALGVIAANEARRHPVCRRAAMLRAGMPLYALTLPMNAARFPGVRSVTYYGFVRDASNVTFAPDDLRSPPFPLAEIRELADRFAPINAARKRL